MSIAFSALADNKKGRRDKTPKFIQSTVDNFASGEQFSSYSMRGPKASFNFKNINPSELRPSTAPSSVGKEGLSQSNLKRENTSRTADSTSDFSSSKKNTALHPNDGKQHSTTSKSVKGQDHV